MSSFPPATDAQLQLLTETHDAYLRSALQSNRDPAAHMRAYNCLFEAASAAGYRFRDDHRSAATWANERLNAARDTAADPLADLRDALAAFDKVGGFGPITGNRDAKLAAHQRLYTAAAAHGFGPFSQVRVDEWAMGRLHGMYMREAA